MPIDIDIQRLNSGQGLAETLISYSTVWHNSLFGKVNKQKRERARKNKLVDDSNVHNCPIKTRRTCDTTHQHSLCFVCDKLAVRGRSFHAASTFLLNKKVKGCATDLKYTRLFAKLSLGDMLGLHVSYNRNCLPNLDNLLTSLMRFKNLTDNCQMKSRAKGIAPAELVSFIESERNDKLAPMFWLFKWVKLYMSLLTELGIKIEGRVNSTISKERILSIISGLTSQAQGQDIIVIFESDIGGAIKNACVNDWDNNTINLARAADIVRKDTFEHRHNFSGSFDPKCEENAVPQSLITLVRMIIQSPNIENQISLNQDKLIMRW